MTKNVKENDKIKSCEKAKDFSGAIEKFKSSPLYQLIINHTQWYVNLNKSTKLQLLTNF